MKHGKKEKAKSKKKKSARKTATTISTPLETSIAEDGKTSIIEGAEEASESENEKLIYIVSDAVCVCGETIPARSEKENGENGESVDVEEIDAGASENVSDGDNAGKENSESGGKETTELKSESNANDDRDKKRKGKKSKKKKKERRIAKASCAVLAAALVSVGAIVASPSLPSHVNAYLQSVPAFATDTASELTGITIRHDVANISHAVKAAAQDASIEACAAKVSEVEEKYEQKKEEERRAAEEAERKAKEAAEREKLEQMPAGSIEIDGSAISLVSSKGAKEAPSGCAGIWKGNASTTDGSYAYLIGHNPGVFAGVLNLGGGSKVTVCDFNGNRKTYTVSDVFTVSRSTTWQDISGRVSSHGECVALQTCITGGGYRIVIAD